MKKITSVLLCVVMLMSVLCTGALAAGTTDSLRATAIGENGVITIKITAAEATTNGKFTVEYDRTCLSFDGYKVAGMLTHVSESTGSVTFSYATTTAEAVAAGKTIIEIRFLVIGNWSFTNIPVFVEEFNENESVDEELAALLVVNPGGSSDPTPPSPPSPPSPPTPPTPPVDPDEDEDEKPGIDLDVPELTEERYNAIVAQYPDAEDHWAEANIVKAINAGLFNGTGANTFSPDGVVTRGMFVTLLYRLSGEPAVTGAMTFSDVDAAQYYADAVIWASSNGIVNGMTATEFAPNAEVSREQMVTMLYRYAKYIESDTDESTKLNGFGDSAEVSDWAKEAMSWAVAEGIITGSNGNLNPADASTRAQIATVLVRFAGL